MSDDNGSFYFQSSRRRSRSGDEEARLPRTDPLATTTVMGRLSALDEQMGALLRGEGQTPGALAEPLTVLKDELAGLAAALKEMGEGQETAQFDLCAVREGQETMQALFTALREGLESTLTELAALRKELRGLSKLPERHQALQASVTRIAEQIDRMGRGTVPLLLTVAKPGSMAGGTNAEGKSSSSQTAGISIDPVQPRLQLGEVDSDGPDRILRLDAE